LAKVAAIPHNSSRLQEFFTDWPAKVEEILHRLLSGGRVSGLPNIQGYFLAWPRLQVFLTAKTIFRIPHSLVKIASILRNLKGHFTARPKYSKTLYSLANVVSTLHNPDNIQGLFTALLRLRVFITAKTIFKDTKLGHYSKILHSL
jgi:hypothetical protein